MKPYKEYKDCKIEGLKTIPNHWTTSFIKRGIEVLTDYEANGSFSSVKENVFFTDDIGYAWYVRATDLEKKDFENYNSLRWVDEKTYNFLDKTRLIGGELLVAKRGEIGKVYLMPEVNRPTTLAPNLYLVRLNDKILPKFGWYYFLSGIGQINLKLKNRSTTMGALYKDDFKEIPFIYPPVVEQTSIALYLDHKTTQIDTLIEKKEKLIEKLKLQRQAIINEAVTKGLNHDTPMKDSGIDWLGEIPEHWVLKKLKYFAKIRNGKDQKEVLIDEGGYPVLGTGGEFGRAKQFLHDKPSVLLGRKGTIDNPLFIEEPFWTVDTLFYTEIQDYICPKFFFYLCKTIHFDYYQESSAVPSMTQDNLNNILLCWTDYNEQKEIADYIDSRLDELDKTNDKIVQSIEKLKLYRQSIISEAVTGKIDVRDWKDETLEKN